MRQPACAEPAKTVPSMSTAKQALVETQAGEEGHGGPWVPYNQHGFSSVSGRGPLQSLRSTSSTITFSFGVNEAGSNGGGLGGCVG